jgi:uncharacterized membrane protein YesL
VRDFYSTYIRAGEMLYMALMTNVLLAVFNLPLLFFFIATDVRVTWLPVLLLAPVLTISLAAAFSVFQRSTVDGTVNVVREFVRAWVVQARRAGATGVVAGLGLLVLAVDIEAVRNTSLGAVAVPLFLTLTALLTATTLHVLVAIVLGVEARETRALWKAALFFAVKRWYLTGMSLFLLLLLLTFIYTTPAWGVGLVTSPILYVVWTNSRQALLPIARTAERSPVEA